VSSAAAATQRDVKPRSRLRRLVWILLVVAVVLGICWAFGWDVRAWFKQLWDVLTQISIGYVIAGCALATVQTLGTAAGWFGILDAAYGRENVRFRVVLACYATAVALNGFLPANLGTLVSLLMFAAVIQGANFSGILGGYAVQKIFFTVAGAFVYVYLFVTLPGAANIEFSWIKAHPWATLAIAAGVVVLVVAVLGVLRPKLHTFWESAKQGGQILAHPRAYFARVALPSFVGWCASLGVIAVFLAAYAIPVSFHIVMQVVGGNSIANVVSVTPGGVGVNQAINTASLTDVTDPTTATAYSLAQQLVTTAWNVLFGLAMVVWVFGWSGGKQLVGDSYETAKQKASERKKRKTAAE
jgi:uncharacterized membrane protein YbhN (UPF0104 family)